MNQVITEEIDNCFDAKQLSDNELLSRFLELVKIPSLSFQERGVADYIIAFCEEHHIDWQEDNAGSLHKGNAGNIIAKVAGNGKSTILFSAHMDTVGPCVSVHPVIQDGIIYSDGSSILGGDDKSGIVAMLNLMKQAKWNPTKYPDLVFVFSIAEEIGLLGARSLDNMVVHGIKAGFILDSSGKPGECVIGAPFMASGTISIQGKEAHAGNAPELGINAFVVAANAVTQMKTGRIDEETTCNFGTVQGGLANNIVMPHITMGFEARSLDETKLKELLDHMKHTLVQTCCNYNAKLSFDVSIDTPGYCLDKTSDLVQLAMQAANDVGIASSCKYSGGGSDTNIYHSLGVRAMTLATGMTKVHTVEEHISIRDLIDTAKWVDAIARKFGR